MTELKRRRILEEMEPGSVAWLENGIIARKRNRGEIGSTKNVRYGYQTREHGRLIQRLVGDTYSKARLELSVARDAIRRRKDKLPPPRRNVPNVADWLTEFLVRDVKRSQRERIRYKRLLTERLGHIPIDLVTTPDVMRYRDWRLRTGVSENTINKECSLLSKAFKDARRRGLVDDNPVTDTWGPVGEGTYYIIKPEEEMVLLDVAPDHIKPIITIALETAMRIGEILALDWRKVDWSKRRILVDESTNGPTKTNRARYVPVTDAVYAALRSLDRKPAGPVFTYHGRPMRSIRKSWATIKVEASKRLGYPFTARIHDMRHSGITRMIAAGRPLMEVQMVAGHSQVSTTQKYTHLAAEYGDLITAMNERREKVSD